MIYKIAKHVYKAVRERGDLTIDELAVAIGRKRQTIYRAEGGQQLLTPEQEEILDQKANLSQDAFGEIMCKALTDLLGRRVRISPRGEFLAATPLMRAADLYSLHRRQLDRKAREKIEAKLHQGRMLEAVADQACSLFEKEIRELVEDALGSDAVADVETD
jgi:DNA-binding XRE family transcriptional regulator